MGYLKVLKQKGVAEMTHLVFEGVTIQFQSVKPEIFVSVKFCKLSFVCNLISTVNSKFNGIA